MASSTIPKVLSPPLPEPCPVTGGEGTEVLVAAGEAVAEGVAVAVAPGCALALGLTVATGEAVSVGLALGLGDSQVFTVMEAGVTSLLTVMKYSTPTSTADSGI